MISAQGDQSHAVHVAYSTDNSFISWVGPEFDEKLVYAHADLLNPYGKSPSA